MRWRPDTCACVLLFEDVDGERVPLAESYEWVQRRWPRRGLKKSPIFPVRCAVHAHLTDYQLHFATVVSENLAVRAVKLSTAEARGCEPDAVRYVFNANRVPVVLHG